MNRKLRTTLPSYPNVAPSRKHAKLKNNLNKQKVRQKTFYDISAKPLPALTNSDPVRVQDTDGWNTKGFVLQEVAPRSITVKTLRCTGSQAQSLQSPEDSTIIH